MKLINITAIKIAPNRQRRVFDAAKLHEFADGIAKQGLFHPIILRIEGDNYTLVAGERRLRAITDIHALGGTFFHDGVQVPADTIPYTTLGELNELDAEEAELSENIHREDLSWQERAAAHSRLKALRDAQSLAAGIPLPSVAAIALEVRGSAEGVNQEITRRELIVARHLDNPEIAGAKSVDEAWKILKKQEESSRNRELGEKVGRTFTADLHKAFQADALIWLAEQAAETFDVILTDPPYGMGADEFGDSGAMASYGVGATGGAGGAHGYADTRAGAERIISTLVVEGFRVAKAQAHLYIFCDIDLFHWIRAEATSAGWWVFRTPLIWYKKSGARAPWPEHGPQRKYETLLYAVKGKRTTLRMAPDVLDYPPDFNLGHAAQKPVALFEDLLRRSCLPGNSVLDPFCGTGTIFPAAHAIKCRAVGVELDQASYGIAVKRIEGLKAQQELDLAIGL